MSDADRDELVVSDRGITVRKSLDTEQFQTLAVVFEIGSEREEPVQARITDTIPDSVPIEDVGFHPEYGSEHWSVTEDTIVFERPFEPGEEYTTVFGVRGLEAEDAADLLSDPAIEMARAGPAEADVDADIPGELEEIVAEENSQVVRDVIAGDRDTMPGMGGEESPPDVEAALDEDAIRDALEAGANDAAAAAAGETNVDGGTDDATDGAAEASAEDLAGVEEVEEVEEPAVDAVADDAPDAATPVPAPDEEPPGTPEVEESVDDEPAAEEPGDAAEGDETDALPAGGVARVLAKELRQGNVSTEDRELLRDELVVAEGSAEARIAHLQSRVSDLEAYGDALEAFLDENGSAQQLLEELRGEVEALGDDVARVEGRVDETASEIADLESWVADDLDDLEERLEKLGASVEDLHEGQERVDDVADRVDEAVDRIDDVEALRDDVARVDETTDRIDELEGDLREMRSDLEEMAAFRENLLTAVGGGATGTDEADEE